MPHRRLVHYINDDASLVEAMAKLDECPRWEGTVPEARLPPTQGGIYSRGGVRHIIFRASTIRLLIDLAREHDEYYQRCVYIGMSAAADLWNMLCNAKNSAIFVPECLAWYMKVWERWDTTGGWGDLSFKYAGMSDRDTNLVEYVATISDNFLHGDKIASNDIDDFWRGYIHGFLSNSVRYAYEIIYATSATDLQAQTRLESYLDVEAVKVEDEDDQPLGIERFRVTLRPDPMRMYWQLIGQAYAARLRGDWGHPPESRSALR